MQKYQHQIIYFTLSFNIILILPLFFYYYFCPFFFSLCFLTKQKQSNPNQTHDKPLQTQITASLPTPKPPHPITTNLSEDTTTKINKSAKSIHQNQQTTEQTQSLALLAKFWILVGMVVENRRAPKRKMNYSIMSSQLREKIMGRKQRRATNWSGGGG